MDNNFKYQNKNDIPVDFVGKPYDFYTSDMNDKIKSSNILINSFTDTKYENKFLNIIDKFEDDKIIWGIKNVCFLFTAI